MLQLLLIVPLLGALYLIDVYTLPIDLVIISEPFNLQLPLFFPATLFLGQVFFSFVVPIKPKRLSKAEQEQFSLSQKEKEILVGLLLGDLHAEKRNANTRFKFIQSTIHEEYLLDLYELFKDFCSGNPKIQNPQPDKRTGKVYSTVRFNTYSLPCFNEFYNLFYLDGIKIVPQNIAELLTPIGLAYLICEDGNWNKVCRYVVLCTESFTLAEVTLLANTLNDKWDLKCYINKTNNGGARIIIPAYSVPILQGLLKDIMPPMMLHKIGRPR